MRFIPKASLRASVLKSQQVHIYLSDIYELIIQSHWPLPLLGRWLANKLTVLLRGFGNWLTPKLVLSLPCEPGQFHLWPGIGQGS